MNKVTLSGLVIGVAFVVAGAVYVAVPSLRSAEDSANLEIRQGVERARRLLASVRENQERLDAVLEGLRVAGVEEPQGEEVPDLVEADRELLGDAEERLAEIARTARARRQELAGKYPATEALPPPTIVDRFGSNAPQMTQAIREGLAARDRLLQENEQLLDEALQSVTQAASVQGGDLSGGDDPAALSLQGAILYAQGTASHRQAAGMRDRAAGPRSELALVGAELARRTAEQTLVADSTIDAKIAAAREQRRALSAQLEELRPELDSVRSTVAELETRSAEQQAIAAAAREALDALAAEDLDARGPGGFGTFAAQYADQSKVYREALGQAQVLEFGSLDNAVIDASGDLIEGAYVAADESRPVASRWGLVHYHDRLAVLQVQAVEMERNLAGLGKDIASMEEARAGLSLRTEASAARAEVLRTRTAEVYEDLAGLLAGAEAAEDKAIQKLETAAKKFTRAAGATKTRQGEAGQLAAALASEVAQRSPDNLFAEDRWLPASSSARAADAQIRLAMIYYERCRDLTLDSKVLASLAEALPERADPEALAELAQAAREAGLEAAQKAIDTLFAAGRDMKQHFALTAEIAAAYYLQSLFNDDAALVRAAIRNYEVAIEGRQDSPYARAYAERLEQLRRVRPSSNK